MAISRVDDSGMAPGGKNKKLDPKKGLLAPFLPGDKELLSQQLASGFGGTPESYAQQLSAMYRPMPVGFNFGHGGGGGQGGGSMPPTPTPPNIPPEVLWRMRAQGWR